MIERIFIECQAKARPTQEEWYEMISALTEKGHAMGYKVWITFHINFNDEISSLLLENAMLRGKLREAHK